MLGAVLRKTLSVRSLRCRQFVTSHSLFLPDKYYTPKHEWISVSDKRGVVGITDYAQSKLGDIVYVQLPDLGRIVSADDECGTIESVKAASEVYTPVSGKILTVNSRLEKETSLLNSAAESDGWMFQIELSNPSELKQLLTREAYERLLQSEE